MDYDMSRRVRIWRYEQPYVIYSFVHNEDRFYDNLVLVPAEDGPEPIFYKEHKGSPVHPDNGNLIRESNLYKILFVKLERYRNRGGRVIISYRTNFEPPDHPPQTFYKDLPDNTIDVVYFSNSSSVLALLDENGDVWVLSSFFYLNLREPLPLKKIVLPEGIRISRISFNNARSMILYTESSLPILLQFSSLNTSMETGEKYFAPLEDIQRVYGGIFPSENRFYSLYPIFDKGPVKRIEGELVLDEYSVLYQNGIFLADGVKDFRVIVESRLGGKRFLAVLNGEDRLWMSELAREGGVKNPQLIGEGFSFDRPRIFVKSARK